jgi:type I restriction enzyme S subunit
MSELYSLPNGWEWNKLGDITTIVGGGTPRTNIKEYWENGNIIWLSPTDLGNIGEIISINNSKTKITKLGLEKSSAKLLPIGTVLFSSRATIGKIAINEIEVSTNQGFTNFICKNLLLNKYLAFCLNRFTSDITDLSNSTTFKEVSKSSLKDFKIPLPPLEEQKRIVAKLDILFAKIDKAIALHQKNIDEADIFMASVLNDVFIELEEKYGKQLLLDGVYIGCKKGFKPTIINGKVPFIGMSDIDEHNGINTKYVMEDYGNVSNGKTKFEKNAVLVGKITPCTQNNKTTIVPSNIDGGFATTEVYALHSMSNMNPYYLNHFMRSKEVNEFLVSTMVGATGRQRVPSESIKNLQISIPPLKTQQKVVSYLDEISNKMEKIKNLQKKKMQSLKELKASILDKVFKGEL